MSIEKPVWGTEPDFDIPEPITNSKLNQMVAYTDQQAATGGNTDPDVDLEKQDSGWFRAFKWGNGVNLGGGFGGGHGGGTKDSPTALPSGHRLGVFYYQSYDGASVVDGVFPVVTPAQMVARATETHSTSAHGTVLEVEVTPIGSTTRQIVARLAAPVVLDFDGTISINADLGNDFEMALGANATLVSIVGGHDKQLIGLWFTQADSGGWAVDFADDPIWFQPTSSDWIPPEFTAAEGAITVVYFQKHAGTWRIADWEKWDE